MEILTLITILTIYIIGAVVAYGLALGRTTSMAPDSPTIALEIYVAVVCGLFSWLGVVAVLLSLFTSPEGRLCFQYRRKG